MRLRSRRLTRRSRCSLFATPTSTSHAPSLAPGDAGADRGCGSPAAATCTAASFCTHISRGEFALLPRSAQHCVGVVRGDVHCCSGDVPVRGPHEADRAERSLPAMLTSSDSEFWRDRDAAFLILGGVTLGGPGPAPPPETLSLEFWCDGDTIIEVLASTTLEHFRREGFGLPPPPGPAPGTASPPAPP